VARSAGDPITGPPNPGRRWGTGFQLASPPAQPMLSPASFGHDGAGGQLVIADPALVASFAYINNQMGGAGDQCANRITAALAECLASTTGDSSAAMPPGAAR
jgi:CubicO group peptidase (beta-lactamase class C family)